MQRWVGFTIVADTLWSYTVDGVPPFELKGGAAIELGLDQRSAADIAAYVAEYVHRIASTG